MHLGYLIVSIMALTLAVACFLAPELLTRLSHALDRSIGAMEITMLKKRSVRYVLGLVLFGVSFGLFRLAYTVPLFR